MPDLARFASFAKGVGLVPPVPPTQAAGGTGSGTEIIKQIQYDRNLVPPVPPQNSDAGNEGGVSYVLKEHDFSAHVEAFDLHCNFEERAAIREYSGGYPRHEAEALAWEDVYGDRSEAA